MPEPKFPDGWTAHELGRILDAMQRLPQWGRPDETVLVDVSGAARARDDDATVIGSFHWCESDAQWRFVPAWRPAELLN